MVLPKNNNTKGRNKSSNVIIRQFLRKPFWWIFCVVVIISFVILSFQQSNRILRSTSSSSLLDNQSNELLRLRSPSSSSNNNNNKKSNNGSSNSYSSIFDEYSNNKITGKFAYSFVISGCDTETYGGSCTAYVLNAIIASTVLRTYGSKSDIIFQVRMLSTTPPNSKLSSTLTNWVKAAKIKIRYLPRVQTENFATATLEKFRVLELIEYDRVYFLDGDLIPLTNMDYHMEMSYRKDCTILQPFVGFQDIEAPVNSGSFIVTPSHGKFQQVMDIVNKQRQSDLPFFNEQIGWGHSIQEGDEWRSWNGNTGRLWNYWGAHYDQGIQYYWFKYLKGNWTYILENGRIENWSLISNNNNNNAEVDEWKRKTTHVFPINIEASLPYDDNNISGGRRRQQTRYYIAKTNIIPKLTGKYPYDHGRPWHTESLGRDFFHYLGGKKPWISSDGDKPITAETIPKVSTSSSSIENLQGRDVWLYWLGVANKTFPLNLPSEFPNLKAVSPFPQVRDQRFALFEPTIDIPIPILESDNIKYE